MGVIRNMEQERLLRKIAQLEEKVNQLRVSRRVLILLVERIEKEKNDLLERMEKERKYLKKRNARYAHIIMEKNKRLSNTQNTLF